MGDDLASAVLKDGVPEYESEFFQVCYNPIVRHGVMLLFRWWDSAKKHHIREIAKHYGVSGPKEVLLFDDDPINIWDTEGCVAVKVDPKIGFRIRDCKLDP
mmetsp:Transcript_16167/g.25097  ORF Transcript_16167/g.25097 Transcript_16167/m.25097 type:complete len:101 (-) Transcript_16167:137-439(-)|eukprot:CAMPEP_0184314912 /NCGR_PEP_ID=MMETSP1049-20130417/78464_1 /TAXON_ID=77928 /ORGANISM="Proteomonas sulcata, Strain CCMP704" /LENGTH=100 /DNA_ID=CAMNT_0026633111 /DNA_START=138 /DNA_END=440 /DNA_ORIENTATION=+